MNSAPSHSPEKKDADFFTEHTQAPVWDTAATDPPGTQQPALPSESSSLAREFSSDLNQVPGLRKGLGYRKWALGQGHRCSEKVSLQSLEEGVGIHLLMAS